LSTPAEFHHYLPIHDADLHLGLYVIGGGRRRICPGQSYPPVEHPGLYNFRWSQGRELPEYQIIFLSQGGGQFESKSTGVVELEESSLIVLFPGVWHRYKPMPDRGWTERWISLNGPDVQRWFEEHALGPEHAVASVQNVDFCERTFDRVLDRVAEEPTHQTAPIRIGAMQLLVLAADHVPRNKRKALELATDERESPIDAVLTDELVKQTMHLIWTQSHRRMNVDSLVSQLPCTRRTLERRFSTAIGHTILEEINHCRLTRAKRLLIQTALPIKPIAYMSGFGNHERLRVLMLEKEGCTPTEYRVRSRSKENPSQACE